MTLNFPDSPSTGDIYDDSTSGFRYEWNGTVWISTDPARAANIKELDDISSGFNGSTTQFNLTVSSSGVEPVSDAQLLISVGGVMQNPTNDYTVRVYYYLYYCAFCWFNILWYILRASVIP